MPDQLPTRLPLIAMPDNRDPSTLKDSKLVNAYAEKAGEGHYQINKRPGLQVLWSLTAGTGNGLYNWKGDIYAIVGGNFYKNGVLVTTVNSAGGAYHFNQTQGVPPYLFMANTAAAYAYDGTTLTQVTDVDYPAATVPGICFLDGTTYVMDAAGAIWGSNLNDPLNWDPLNKIVANAESDAGIAIAKQLVYVVAFKQWSTQFFYDAANSVGSPLLPVPASNLPYGCAFAESVQDIDGSLYWVCTNRTSSAQVIRCTGLQPTIISTKPVERLLDDVDYTGARSWFHKDMGHTFYCLTIPANNLTLVYDITEGLWAQWTDTNGNYFPAVASTFNSSLEHILQHISNGKVYTADQDYYTDDGNLFSVDIITPNFDAGTRYNKYLTKMLFAGDQVSGSVLNVRCSEDDYKTWSNFRSVNLSNLQPSLFDCGSFRRRAYHLRHRCNTSLRLSSVDLQMQVGVA